jgi:hypothetical protein
MVRTQRNSVVLKFTAFIEACLIYSKPQHTVLIRHKLWFITWPFGKISSLSIGALRPAGVEPAKGAGMI